MATLAGPTTVVQLSRSTNPRPAVPRLPPRARTRSKDPLARYPTDKMSKRGTDTAILTPPGADGIAIVTLDHYPVNSLSRGVTNAVTRAIQAIEKDPSVKGVVVHGAGRCFCAGADISQFGAKLAEEVVPMGRPVTDMLGFEYLSVPVVAAIHGYALGGGLEAALGCHYR